MPFVIHHPDRAQCASPVLPDPRSFPYCIGPAAPNKQWTTLQITVQPCQRGSHPLGLAQMLYDAHPQLLPCLLSLGKLPLEMLPGVPLLHACACRQEVYTPYPAAGNVGCW